MCSNCGGDHSVGFCPLLARSNNRAVYSDKTMTTEWQVWYEYQQQLAIWNMKPPGLFKWLSRPKRVKPGKIGWGGRKVPRSLRSTVHNMNRRGLSL